MQIKMTGGGWLLAAFGTGIWHRHLAPAFGRGNSNQGVLRCMRVMMIRPLPIICLISLVLTTPSLLWRCSCSHNGARITTKHKCSKPPVQKHKIGVWKLGSGKWRLASLCPAVLCGEPAISDKWRVSVMRFAIAVKLSIRMAHDTAGSPQNGIASRCIPFHRWPKPGV